MWRPLLRIVPVGNDALPVDSEAESRVRAGVLPNPESGLEHIT
jgi:hypothetical protein